MTDKKISELTSNGALTGSELVELVQSGGGGGAVGKDGLLQGGGGGGGGGAPYGTGGLFGNNLDVFGNTQIVPTSGATATTANTTQNGGLGGRESKSAILDRAAMAAMAVHGLALQRILDGLYRSADMKMEVTL